MILSTLILVLLLACLGQTVDLNFEHPETGFFLRPKNLDDVEVRSVDSYKDEILKSPTWDKYFDIPNKKSYQNKDLVDIKRFTVLDPSQSALIKASYGPFSTKQTVPAKHMIPDFYDEIDNTTDSNDIRYTDTISPLVHQLQVSAHLVTEKISRVKPSIRVLVHGSGGNNHHALHACISVYVRKGPDVLFSSCTPIYSDDTGGDATCLVAINVPPGWWTPRPPNSEKMPKTFVDVSYSVGTTRNPEECAHNDISGYGPSNLRIIVQPETSIRKVLLEANPEEFEEVASHTLVRVLVPKNPLTPGTTFHTPLYMNIQDGDFPAIVLVIRCKVRNGTRIVGVEALNTAWKLTVDYNPRKSSASVTAMLANPQPSDETLRTLGLHEMFSWIFEISPDAHVGESKITWIVQYTMNSKQEEIFNEREERMNAWMKILKDDVQAVLPIAKSDWIVNTAVLTGRQVARPMKILIVSQAGRVADVTLQATCSCTDTAALKASSSCTSIYLDGSEIHGSENATVVATYGPWSGSTSFGVWMPEFPLEIHLDDDQLSRLRGWKVPKTTHRFVPTAPPIAIDNKLEVQNQEESKCVPKYQQTKVEVYTKLMSVDEQSGRKSYLMSRQTSFRITDIIRHLIRISDVGVATIKKNFIIGKAPGVTKVQVISAITGRVIGANELRVTQDEVFISRLNAKIISGLTLALKPDPDIEAGFEAVTTISQELTAKYQEGIIDISIEFGDGSITPVRELDQDSIKLSIASLRPAVLAVAPSTLRSQPRVIAIREGAGEFLQVSMKTSPKCGSFNEIITTMANVSVKFTHNLFDDFGKSFVGNEVTEKIDKNRKSAEDKKKNLDDIDREQSSPDDKKMADAAVVRSFFHQSKKNPAVQARTHTSLRSPHSSSLETGMYTLLGVFGIALAVFAGFCATYAYRERHEALNHSSPLGRKNSFGNESVTNAHDWVWLGKATLERASGSRSSSGNLSPNSLPPGCIMPLSDLNGRDQYKIGKSYQKLSKNSELNKLITQINITENPNAEMEPLLLNEDSSFGKRSPISQTQNTENLGINLLTEGQKTSRNQFQGSINFFNLFNKNSYLSFQDEAIPPPIPPHGINVNNFTASDSPISNQTENFPVINSSIENESTKQHFRLAASSGIRPMKNVNRHPLIVRQKDDFLDDARTKFVEVNADDFIRLRAEATQKNASQIRSANILTNHMISASPYERHCAMKQQFDNNLPSINYDQLINYFMSLRESDA